jgi:O-antigen/teichoic acid export membrane protein
MKVAYPMLISSAMTLFMNWTDTLMLGYYRDMDEVGLYRVLFKTAGFLTISQFAINSMIGPMIGTFNATRDFKSFRSVLRQVGLINLAISTPLFLFVVIFPNFILGLMGDEINEGVNILRLLALSQLLNVWSGPVLNVLNMTGKERIVRTVITTASVLNIVLNFILIPNYGYAGASVATIVSTLIWNGAGVYLVWKYYRAMTFPIIGYFTKIDD